MSSTETHSTEPAAIDPPLSSSPLLRPAGGSPSHVAGAKRLSRALLTVDVAALSATAVAVGLLGERSLREVGWTLIFAVAALIGFALKQTYRSRLRPEMIEDVRTIVIVVTVAAMVTLTLRVVFDDSPHLAEETAQVWILATGYLIAARLGLRIRERGAGRTSAFVAPTLIFGAGEVGSRLAQRLLSDPKSELRPVGFLDKEPLNPNRLPVPVLGRSWDLERVILEQRIDHVLISFSTAPPHVVIDVVRRCEALGIAVSVVPRLFESTQGRLAIDYFGALPLVTVRRADPNGWSFRCKYMVDRLLALVAIVVFSPLLLIVAVAVLISLGRPVLFRQARVGKDGRIFELLKFRSMKEGKAAPTSDATVLGDEAPGGVEGSDRRTKVGTFIRRTSLDELPQLFNALKGEMSIVGPRPERPEYVERFEQRVHRYGERHRVKVGITGWSQIHGLRGRTSLSDRIEWDNFYVENWSPWLDMKIILLTIVAVFRTAKIAE
jgi:exopolysaccharide biosynthesis polyprenyl glycosylphosphotransferase